MIQLQKNVNLKTIINNAIANHCRNNFIQIQKNLFDFSDPFGPLKQNGNDVNIINKNI